MNVVRMPRRCSCVASVAVETRRSVSSVSASTGAAPSACARVAASTFGIAPSGSSGWLVLDHLVANPPHALDLDLDHVAGLEAAASSPACP